MRKLVKEPDVEKHSDMVSCLVLLAPKMLKPSERSILSDGDLTGLTSAAWLVEAALKERDVWLWDKDALKSGMNILLTKMQASDFLILDKKGYPLLWKYVLQAHVWSEEYNNQPGADAGFIAERLSCFLDLLYRHRASY